MADYTVEKLGSEDINFGTGTFNRTSRVTPGSTVAISQVRASDIPILDAASDFTATEVESALAEIGKTSSVQVRIPIQGAEGLPFITLLLAEKNLIVKSVQYVPDYSFIESSTNYTSFAIVNRYGAGIGNTVLTSKTFNGAGTTNIGTQPIPFGTISNANVSDGDVLVLYTDPTAGGNGTPFFPHGLISVEFSW